ncbi:hypothetical protein [Roseibium aquae]|nr:hypothetical protein [Roseibium aquae]
MPFPFDRNAYHHEHERPRNERLVFLRSEAERLQLVDMWEMILTADYQVSDIEKLDYERREEFLDVIELLVKAFDA